MIKPLTPAELMRRLMDDFQDNVGQDSVASLFQPETVQRQRLMEKGIVGRAMASASGKIAKKMSSVSKGAEAYGNMKKDIKKRYEDLVLTFNTWLKKTDDEENAIKNSKRLKTDREGTLIDFFQRLGFTDRNIKEFSKDSKIKLIPTTAPSDDNNPAEEPAANEASFKEKLTSFMNNAGVIKGGMTYDKTLQFLKSLGFKKGEEVLKRIEVTSKIQAVSNNQWIEIEKLYNTKAGIDPTQAVKPESTNKKATNKTPNKNKPKTSTITINKDKQKVKNDGSGWKYVSGTNTGKPVPQAFTQHLESVNYSLDGIRLLKEEMLLEFMFGGANQQIKALLHDAAIYSIERSLSLSGGKTSSNEKTQTQAGLAKGIVTLVNDTLGGNPDFTNKVANTYAKGKTTIQTMLEQLKTKAGQQQEKPADRKNNAGAVKRIINAVEKQDKLEELSGIIDIGLKNLEGTKYNSIKIINKAKAFRSDEESVYIFKWALLSATQGMWK